MQEYVRKLCRVGGVVNRAIVIAAATGIVQHNNPAMFRAYGGPVELRKKWADSILLRMGLVKRKATKAARRHHLTLLKLSLHFYREWQKM